LENIGVQHVNYRGISDVAINSRKILGSSIYRKRKAVFYHAVLNISEPVETIERYIKHPTKEPDYRKGRSHKEFVTSLYNEGYTFTVSQLKDALNASLAGINDVELVMLEG
jgi:lipoate-protein ligase A